MSLPAWIKDFLNLEPGISKNDVWRVILWGDNFCFVKSNTKVLDEFKTNPTLALCLVLC